MAAGITTLEKLRPDILRVAKKCKYGIQSKAYEIVEEARKDKALKDISESTLVQAVTYARRKLGLKMTRQYEPPKPQEKELSDEDYLEHQKKTNAEKKQSKDFKDREKYYLSEIQRLEKLLSASATISKTPQIYKIEKQKTKRFSQSTPIIFASDWHYEEEVKPETVSGLNEFNLSIADQRIQNFIRNSTRLLEIHSKDTEIRDVIFALGGDFITGDIHRDNIESCQLSPTEALWAVQNHLASCIEHYLKETDFNFIIPCHSGNHARTTKEQLWANEQGHSLEWLMYNNLAHWFKNEPRLKFMIADGLHLYIDVAGFDTRTHHGHAIKYNGGVGGITIPVNKAIGQWNKGRRASHDYFGHYHTYLPSNNFNCNGSLIGYNPYAMSSKCDFEKPVQSFSLINHEEKMISINAKIFL